MANFFHELVNNLWQWHSTHLIPVMEIQIKNCRCLLWCLHVATYLINSLLLSLRLNLNWGTTDQISCLTWLCVILTRQLKKLHTFLTCHLLRFGTIWYKMRFYLWRMWTIWYKIWIWEADYQYFLLLSFYWYIYVYNISYWYDYIAMKMWLIQWINISCGVKLLCKTTSDRKV